MDYHFKEFFHEFSEDSPSGNYHKVICLSTLHDLDWNDIVKKAPDLPRAWYELSRLSLEERVEFLNQYWTSKMKYHPGVIEILDDFFKSLDDIGIFLIQKTYGDPFIPQLFYSLSNNRGFFRGLPPASEKELLELQHAFSDTLFPQDYLAFLQIHNGFYKTTDCTGLIRSQEMLKSYHELQSLVNANKEIFTENNQPVNPKTLIPFYKSFGMPFYQCFWSEWYPEDEMGVVYYSDATQKISKVSDSGTSIEALCFATFTDWLMFYLEPIDV